MVQAPASASMEMDEAVALSILGWAAAAHPLEACGLLVGPTDGPILRATTARNLAPDPRVAFEIDPGHIAQWQRRAREQGHALLGCWHSHPDGGLTPSAADRAGATWPGLLWLILGNGAMRLWKPGGAGFVAVPLVRRHAAA